MAKRNVHKAIKILAWVSIISAILSFIFLIVYVVAIVGSVNEEGIKEENVGLALFSLIAFVFLLILFEILDVIIGIITLVTKDNFASESNWMVVLCISAVIFFFSGYIGFCGMIAIIVIASSDARKELPSSSSSQQTQNANVVTATVIQGPPPTNVTNPSAVPAGQYSYQPPPGQAQPYAQPMAQPYEVTSSQPYGVPPTQSYGY